MYAHMHIYITYGYILSLIIIFKFIYTSTKNFPILYAFVFQTETNLSGSLVTLNLQI